MKDYILKCQNINFWWDNTPKQIPIIKDISFNVKKGEFISIIGPSGCGKSTMLSLLCGARKVKSGTIMFNDNILNKPCKEIGLVFQEYSLFSWLNVAQNIEFGMKLHNKTKQQRRTKISTLIKQIQMEEHINKYPHELSGGMRQRIAIARLLANNPDIILMDEPFGALDYQTRIGMSKLLYDIWKQFKKTIIFVTHDIEEAILLSNRIFLMSAHSGIIKEILEIEQPATINNKKFLNTQNYIRDYLIKEST